MTSARRFLNPYVTFLGLIILISVIGSQLAHTGSSIIAGAASFDLTATVTLLYYLLLVRPGLRSPKSLILVAVLGLWRASFLFPKVVPGKAWIGAGIEAVVFTAVGAGLWRARRSNSDGDPLDRLRHALAAIIPIPAVARLLASEFVTLYYAFNWRAKPHVPPGCRTFTMHKRTMAADLFYCMSLVSLLEILPFHLLVNRWSHMAAWILTGISIYGAIWLIAMARTFHLRPSLIGPEGITIRYGLMFHLHSQDYRITAESPPDSMIVPRGTTPAVYLEFPEPLTAEIIVGIPKKVSAIGLAPDEPTALEESRVHRSRLRKRSRILR